MKYEYLLIQNIKTKKKRNLSRLWKLNATLGDWKVDTFSKALKLMYYGRINLATIGFRHLSYDLLVK